MLKFFANRKLVLLLFGIMLFIAIMGLTLPSRAQLSVPEQLVRDTVGWMQQVVAVPTRAVYGFFDEWRQIGSVHEENERLRKSMHQNARDRFRLNQLEADNKRLQRALAFTESQKQLNNYNFYYADVISQSDDGYSQSLVINLGEKDGIRVDMPVVTVEGLIGRIENVSQYHSTVELLLQLNSGNKSGKPFAVTVRNKEDTTFGIIEEYDRKNSKLKMTKIEALDPLKVGDEIVTSGLGELFPSGLTVGKVASRKVGEYGITHEAEIKPSANFQRLRDVFVVEVPIER